MNDIDFTKLEIALRGITFSETEVSRIMRCRRSKVAKKIGNNIRAEQKTGGNGRVACNAFDVLIPIIRQCVTAHQCGVNIQHK